MLLLNIFAHLATNAVHLIRSIKHITPKLLLAALLMAVTFSACKNKQGGEDATKSLEDSLADKYGKGSEVIAQLNEDIANSPNNPELYYRRALQWAREENPIKALQDIKKAVSMEPENALYRFALGEVYFANDSVTGAMNSFNKAVELKPDFTEALLKLGELQMILFQHSESNTTFDKLLEIDPNSAAAYYFKGRNYVGMKDTVRGIIQYKKSVSLDNDYYEAYVQLGSLFSTKGGKANLKLAEEYFTNAIRIKEVSAEAYYARALVYYDMSAFDMNAYDKARTDYEKVLAINPDDYRPYSGIGLINLNLNQFEKAIEAFDKALLMKPDYVRGYYLRALTYESKGDYPNAIKDYEQVVAMDVDYVAAKEALAELKKKTRK